MISSGGGSGSSASYQAAWTIGQTAVGSAGSDNYSLYMGFWQDFGGGGCCEPPYAGNVDCTGDIDIGDVTMMIIRLFIEPGSEFCCLEEADLDYTGLVDVGDLTILIRHLFVLVEPTPPCP